MATQETPAATAFVAELDDTSVTLPRQQQQQQQKPFKSPVSKLLDTEIASKQKDPAVLVNLPESPAAYERSAAEEYFGAVDPKGAPVEEQK